MQIKRLKKTIIFQKPLSYVNLSGDYKKILKFFKINKSNIIVFQDDLDIQFSKIKIKFDGGHGGHNGIRNIIEKITMIFRIKLGIKNLNYLENNISAEKFVLGKFNKDELSN